MSIAVLDVDGVVADVRHRLHHLSPPGGRRRDWSAFFAAAADDPVLWDGRELARRLAQEHTVVWLTGRPEWLRSVTHRWLDDAGLLLADPSGDLVMRPGHDRRPAAEFKLGALRRLAARGIAAFVDDDADVVDAAVAAGYPAALADWVTRTPTMREAQDRLGRT